MMMMMTPRLGWRMVLVTLTLALTSGVSAAQIVSAAPVELVERAVENEIKARSEPTKYKFRDRKETPQGSSVKLMVQTKEAMAGLVVAYDDHPLGPNQQKAEMERLQHLINDPDALRKKAAQEKENRDRIERIIRALPTAFLYEKDGVQTGTKTLGRAGDELVRLKFRQNPAYEPPSRIEQVLVGMQGHILIDRKNERIVQIDGTLDRDVAFGWGILGHLDRGGHILLEQSEDNGFWQLTRMDIAFTGKLLLFKNIDVKSNEVYSDFEIAPSNLSFAQGVALLQNEQTAMAGQPGNN
jgi:hypothetical protein